MSRSRGSPSQLRASDNASRSFAFSCCRLSLFSGAFSSSLARYLAHPAVGGAGVASSAVMTCEHHAPQLSTAVSTTLPPPELAVCGGLSLARSTVCMRHVAGIVLVTGCIYAPSRFRVSTQTSASSVWNQREHRDAGAPHSPHFISSPLLSSHLRPSCQPARLLCLRTSLSSSLRSPSAALPSPLPNSTCECTRVYGRRRSSYVQIDGLRSAACGARAASLRTITRLVRGIDEAHERRGEGFRVARRSRRRARGNPNAGEAKIPAVTASPSSSASHTHRTSRFATYVMSRIWTLLRAVGWPCGDRDLQRTSGPGGRRT